MSEKQPMQKFRTSNFIPVLDAELRWVFIDAPGKPAQDLAKPNRKQASIYVKSDNPGLAKLKAHIKKFWDENKSKGQRMKSNGIRVEEVVKEGVDKNAEDFDADDTSNYEKTGMTAISFWTGANWPDGNDRVVDVHNAKGNKVSLGGKKIGNGSYGAIEGTMAMYHNGTNHGVSLYLNAIQIVKFNEFTQEADFGSEGEEVEGGFEGVEPAFEEVKSETEPKAAEARPKL